MKDLNKEILKLRVQLEKETNKDIRKVLLEKKKELEKMRKLVGSVYMEYADDEGIIDIDGVERNKVMREVEKEVVKTRDTLAKSTVAIAGAALLKSYVDSYYKTANTIDKGIGININYKLLRREFIDAVVSAKFENQSYSDRIWENTDWLANKLYSVIEDGIKEGKSIQKMSKEIKDAFGSNAFQAERLIRTESARVVSEAQDNIYKDSGVVSRVMWVATLDDSTNTEDAELDGNIYDIDDTSRPQPPLHPNCRCAIIPVIEGWKPTTRRDNITKETIEYIDYNSWAKDNIN